MNESEATNKLRILLEQDVEQVQFWLDQVWAEKQQISDDFNWYGLAEIAASQARELALQSPPCKLLSLAWAKVAISVYEFLINHQIKYEIRESFFYSLMMLRAYMIVKFGISDEDSILDTNPIVDWFFDNLNLTYEEAISRTSSWQELFTNSTSEKFNDKLISKREDILQLRLIKNRLGVIKLLMDSHKLCPNEELKAWLLIREKLP